MDSLFEAQRTCVPLARGGTVCAILEKEDGSFTVVTGSSSMFYRIVNDHKSIKMIYNTRYLHENARQALDLYAGVIPYQWDSRPRKWRVHGI